MRVPILLIEFIVVASAVPPAMSSWDISGTALVNWPMIEVIYRRARPGYESQCYESYGYETHRGESHRHESLRSESYCRQSDRTRNHMDNSRTDSSHRDNSRKDSTRRDSSRSMNMDCKRTGLQNR
jgi:hypothetical protein